MDRFGCQQTWSRSAVVGELTAVLYNHRFNGSLYIRPGVKFKEILFAPNCLHAVLYQQDLIDGVASL